MNGACSLPFASRSRTAVGGAFRRFGRLSSGSCGATNGANAAATAMAASTIQPALRIGGARCAWIDCGEEHIRDDRVEREEDRAGAGAAGDQIHVAREQRI